MFDPFVLKLILAFIVGAVWVTGATMLAERFGSKVGGAILGVPSVAFLGLFFIGWTQSPAVASEATTVMPLIMGLCSLFIAVYIVFVRYNFYLAVIVSLLVWFILALGLVVIQFNSLFVSLVGFVILLVFSYIVVEKIVKVPSVGQKKIQRTFSGLAFRAVLSGGIIAFAVAMTKVGGPLLGGVFASFPGLTVATIIITYFAHGREFSAAVTKMLLVTGPLNVAIYVVCVRYLYLSVGLVWGTMLAFVISLITSYLTYLYLNKKMS